MPLKQYEVITFRYDDGGLDSYDEQLEAFLNEHVQPYQRVACIMFTQQPRFVLEARD